MEYMFAGVEAVNFEAQYVYFEIGLEMALELHSSARAVTMGSASG